MPGNTWLILRPNIIIILEKTGADWNNGTNGKTTSTHLIYHLLNYSNKKKQKKIAGLIGTVNVDTGKRIIPGDLTTPDPGYLAKILKGNG